MPSVQVCAVAASATPDPAPGGPGWPGRLGLALVGCGLAMLPWLVFLAVTLPAAAIASHWATAWAGLDALEALGLVVTGGLLRRRDPRCCLAAAATAMLLITDAWFDVTTAAPGADLVTAIATAACAELPMAALCLTLAIRSVPRPARACPARACPARACPACACPACACPACPICPICPAPAAAQWPTLRTVSLVDRTSGSQRVDL